MWLVLLDRDGVLNEDRADYVKIPAELNLLPGAAAAVARLNRANAKVAVVSNQSAVGRGLIDESMLARIHEKLTASLAAEGASLDAILVAPDAPDAATEWRKPGAGMLREAMEKFGAGADATVMIGDSARDLVAAARIGCRRHLVRTGHGAHPLLQGVGLECCPIEIVDDLAAAADRLLADRRVAGRLAERAAGGGAERPGVR
ncbi:MAG: D-glycero-alpha-D-manno-heptose-1,7-bisphosphate 7-phosphatase [Alphaproteobacteria bacterium]